MKTIDKHPLYGRLVYDSETDKVTVSKGNLAERLTWLLNHQEMLGPGYYPNAFLRACEFLGRQIKSVFPVPVGNSIKKRRFPNCVLAFQRARRIGRSRTFSRAPVKDTELLLVEANRPLAAN
jgi:hypothetical protein